MKFLDYIQGVRRGKAAHRIEHEAMGDPFLSEAIEGYDSIEGNHANRIARMQASVLARTARRETQTGAWKIAVAAVAVIALLSGYFALMNHKSSMALANELENSYINLYAPEIYIEQRRLELTAMIENDPSQNVSVESVVPIANLDEVIKPVEVLPLYIPGVYADLKKDVIDAESAPLDETKKIFIAEGPSSILAEAKVSRPQSTKAQVMPDKLRDAWTTKEVTEVTRSRAVEVNKANARGANQRVMGLAVADNPKETSTKETEATSTIRVDAHEARLLAEQAGFDKIEVVGADELDGNALELNEVETTKRTITRESVYRPKASSRSLVSGSTKRTKPEPLIGNKAYKAYLKENIIRPQDGECKNKKGKVIVQFSVDKNGNPVDIYVTKALCKDLDREAVRLVKNGPKWKYGTLRVDVEVEF
ncbi:energy transducer TonB [Dysgonomonas sp. HGC4]|uniref:energy transducer TonB n=1 Tax=Dysgonomonas sp. HGC4 TaxID=1658009 RepID=UPI000682C877|nr:energy transducer TonB [Dysgonomonas sp. HGC4]MBD8347110.1 energy transducer TonB [Dysgonomonas sp. HGC4]